MTLVTNGFDQLELARKRSVKLGDIPPGGTTVLQLFVPSTPTRALLPPALPFGTWQRDRYLSITPRADAQWGAAIGIAVAKVAALAWDVKSDVSLRSRRAHELCMLADSAVGQGGWVQYIAKQVRDYTCTNMGAVTEIVRETLSFGSRIVGINHLPAVRCRRTGDPERPIMYIDKGGREHILNWWQVIYFSDLPDPDEITFGGGLCAAERAYPQIIKMSALENYVYEKVSGSRPLAIHVINGLRTDQIQDAIRQAEEDQAASGFSSYMGAVIMATIKPDAGPAIATIPLAELPDGFDAVSERARADLIYSNSLGLDPQDLVPLSNTPLGTAAQSQVLHEKSKGRGLMMFRQAFVHAVNQMVFDDKTKFSFIEKDYDDQIKKATISQMQATIASQRIQSQITDANQERQLMVDRDELPKDFISQDMTTDTLLSDSDKPGVDDAPPKDGPLSTIPKPVEESVSEFANKARELVASTPVMMDELEDITLLYTSKAFMDGIMMKSVHELDDDAMSLLVMTLTNIMSDLDTGDVDRVCESIRNAWLTGRDLI